MSILTILAAASVYSPSFFWMWNAPIEVGKYKAQLDEMAKNGVMNVCIHPVPKEFRPDLFATEMSPAYLSDEYLERYAAIVHHAAELGMSSYLYDEGGWPSGGACGLVMKADKEGRFRHQGLFPDGENGYKVVIRPYGPGGANYPSPIEKGMVECFLSLTHERIKSVLGDQFGKAIKVAFMDEPGFTSWYSKGGIAWCSDFAEEFERRKGYDLKPYLPRLVRERNEASGDLLPIWLDYREVLGDLFVDRFVGPIRDWCRKNGLESGGHFSGEHEPNLFYLCNFGDLLKDLRAMDVPGVDVIWRQVHPLTWPAAKISLPFARYAASAAHYNGSTKALCELGAIYSNSLTPAEYKWLTDYFLVRGINLFVYGYSAVDNSGSWQILFEPNHGTVNPLWPYMKPFFKGLNTLAEELSRGESAIETAVFFDNRSFVSSAAAATVAANAQIACAIALDELHCDYDFADDDVIENGVIENGRLLCGKMRYSTVVVPARGRMKDSTWRKLEEFRKAGGKVLGPNELDQVKPVCKVSGVLANDIRATKRFVGDKTYYFLVNENLDESYDLVIDLGVSGPLVVMDPVTGEKRAVEHKNGVFPWKFAIAGSALFIAGESAEEKAKVLYEPKKDEGLTLDKGWTIEPLVRYGSKNDELTHWTLSDGPLALEALGDWRKTLGLHFSGRVRYRNRFEAEGGRKVLDLGKVCWAAKVFLNGKELQPKFVGPFRWEVELEQGENELVVEVANLLSVMMSDETWRNEVCEKFVIYHGYEKRMRVYEHSNSDSGLFGPVTLQ